MTEETGAPIAAGWAPRAPMAPQTEAKLLRFIRELAEMPTTIAGSMMIADDPRKLLDGVIQSARTIAKGL